MTPDAESRPSPALVRALLLVAVGGVSAALLAATGWYLRAHRAVRLEELQPSQRQELFAQIEKAAPGVFEATWFEPRIGYTLKPEAKLEVWNDAFESNELGYRTGALAKRPGIFRILFLGDSWTYGMGIKEAESFPKVLEGLAPEPVAGGRAVECWTLALPGYNLLNEIAAFELWETALAPDAVVIVPSSNDNESTPQVSPKGELYAGSASPPDAFGEPHSVWHSFPWLFDGYRALARWRISFDRVRGLELHLRRRGVPSALLFVARWRPEIAHRFVAESGIESPYAVVPEALTLGDWLTNVPNPHGNARANRVYAHLLYRLLERPLDWPSPSEPDPVADSIPLFSPPLPEAEWSAPAAEWLRSATRKFVPEQFAPGPATVNAWSGPGDPATGVIGLATTLLVHPPEGTKRLTIRVRRLDEVAEIYPLGLEVSVPSPSGGTRVRTTVRADGPAAQEFEIAVPPDRAGDQALEVVFQAERVSSESKSLVARSLAIESIRPSG